MKHSKLWAALSVVALLSACSSDSDNNDDGGTSPSDWQIAPIATDYALTTCPTTAQEIVLHSRTSGSTANASFTVLTGPIGSSAYIEGENRLYVDLPGDYTIEAVNIDTHGPGNGKFTVTVHSSLQRLINEDENEIIGKTFALNCDNQVPHNEEPLRIKGTTLAGSGSIETDRDLYINRLVQSEESWLEMHANPALDIDLSLENYAAQISVWDFYTVSLRNAVDSQFDKARLKNIRHRLSVNNSQLSISEISPINQVEVTNSDINHDGSLTAEQIEVTHSNLSHQLRIEHTGFGDALVHENYWGTTDLEKIEARLESNGVIHYLPIAEQAHEWD
ncbi:hypothetical protein [Vibrio sp. WXL103]|uniref:hypothetical protein n=1 Tax=unclassified Vibrio TaxID=2614977 RepID=UPI003EC8E9BB